MGVADLTDKERIVVNMLDLGFNVNAIHKLTRLGHEEVRRIVSGLCEDYECSAWQLPEKVRDDE